jgi:hypothetical protein
MNIDEIAVNSWSDPLIKIYVLPYSISLPSSSSAAAAAYNELVKVYKSETNARNYIHLPAHFPENRWLRSQ